MRGAENTLTYANDSSAIERFGATEVGPPRLSVSLVSATLALNLLGLAVPLVILQIYDRILPNQSYATLSALLMGLAVVLLLDAILRLARGSLSNWTATRWEHRTSCAAVTRLLEAELRSVDADTTGRHLDRLTAIEQLRDYYGGQGRLVLIDLPFVLLYLGLIWAIAGPLVALPVGILMLLGAAVLIAGRRLKQALALRNDLDDRRYSFILETLGHIGTVKALACEPFMLRRYERLQQAGAEATHDTIARSNAAQTLGTLFTGVMLVAVVSAGALMVIDGQLTLGGVAASTLLAGRAAQPVLRALGLWTHLQSLSLAKEKLDELMALPQSPVRLTATDGGEEQRLSGAIKIRDLVFHDNNGRCLFERLDLDVAPGEMISIAGESGSGKSTLLALIAGDLPADAGEISFDGRSVRTHGRSVRRQIALVGQNPVLFSGTLLENLTLFEESDAVDRALTAARALGLDEDVHRLPGGWDTRVAEGIVDTLPASLRQKVAIVRTLARKPRILLLDESNTALDSGADARLRGALSAMAGETTIIMMTLRPSFQRLADRQLMLSAGKLRSLEDAPTQGFAQLP